MKKIFGLILGLTLLFTTFAGAAEKRILYTERAVGAGHPTFTDTLNRLTLVEHNNDGTHDILTQVIDPWVDVRAAGAGLTDAEIIAAIALLPANGGTVQLQGTTYTLSNKVSIPSNVILRGREGAYDPKTVLSCNVSADACLSFGDGSTLVTNSRAEYLTVLAGTATDGIGIDINYGRWITLHEVSVRNFVTGTGIRITGSTTGGNPAIANKLKSVWIGNNLTNLHLTGEDANNDSSADEGLFEDVRINLSALANSKGVYIEAGSWNSFERLSIIDSAVTSGTTAIYLDDGARSTTYAANSNQFRGVYLEKITTGVYFGANCSGNIVHDFPALNLAIPVNDLSGGGNIVRFPSSGINGTFINMTHHDQTYQNLLPNGEQERWEAGTAVASTDWTLVGASATVARDTSNERKGTYSAAITRVGNDATYTAQITPYIYLKGRWVTAGAWIKSSVADSVQLRITDGVSGASGIFHTGGGAYEFLTARYKVDASATRVDLNLRVRTTNGTAYLDSGIFQEGYELTLPVDPPAILDSQRLYHTFTYNPGDLADGTGETHQEAMVGAALGDFVMVAAPYDLQDIIATAYVQATDTIEIRLQNENAGANVNLASGTWRVIILKY